MATKRRKTKKKAAKKAKDRRVCMVVPANKKVKLVYKKGAKRPRRRKAKK
jgi:hypothetical protein